VTWVTKDIADHLKASVAILDAFSDDIYPEVIPQERKDRWEQALVLNDLSNDPEYYLGGEAGTHTTIIQIDVWTNGVGGKARANELGELIRNRLSGYRGTFGTGCYGTARMIRNDSVAAPPVDGSDKHRRRVSMDFKIINTASVPTLT
jgi:hypothetical protein